MNPLQNSFSVLNESFGRLGLESIRISIVFADVGRLKLFF